MQGTKVSTCLTLTYPKTVGFFPFSIINLCTKIYIEQEGQQIKAYWKYCWSNTGPPPTPTNSWGVSVWSFMIIGWLQSQLSSGNHFQITMRHDLDLWPFDLKINRAHPWLMVSKCMKFHDHRLITESVIVRKPFSNNHAPWPWPLTFWPQNQ